MALTLAYQPSQSNAAYTNLPYVVNSATNINEPQFKYVLDVYVSGSTERLARLTQGKNATDSAVFDPSRVFQSNLSFDEVWTSTTSSAVEQFKNFELKFGEQYSTSTTSSIIVSESIVTVTASIAPAVKDANNAVWRSDITQAPQPNSGEGYWLYFASQSILSDYKYTDLVDEYADSTLFLSSSDYHTISVYNPYGGVQALQFTVLKNDGTPVNALPDPKRKLSLAGVDESNNQIVHIGIGPKNLLEYGGNIAADASSSLAAAVVVELTDNVGAVTDSIRYRILPKWNEGAYGYLTPGSKCGDGRVRFAFINRWGMWDYYNVWNPVRKTTNLERISEHQSRVDWARGDARYDEANRGLTDYFIQPKDNYVVTTDILNKNTASWVEQLLSSPYVYIQEDNGFVPIIITNSSYRVLNYESRDKTFQYDIQYTYANSRRPRTNLAEKTF